MLSLGPAGATFLTTAETAARVGLAEMRLTLEIAPGFACGGGIRVHRALCPNVSYLGCSPSNCQHASAVHPRGAARREGRLASGAGAEGGQEGEEDVRLEWSMGQGVWGFSGAMVKILVRFQWGVRLLVGVSRPDRKGSPWQL